MPARLAIIFLVVQLVLSTVQPAHAQTQTSTEVRDPLRGVTFFSTSVSTDSLIALQMRGSSFSSSDTMTLGFSAFLFDESETVDEYVLWLRHDGPRRWLAGDIKRPLTLYLDGVATDYAPFHLLRPRDNSNRDMFVEKLEFALNPKSFQALLTASEVTLELRTLLGAVKKTFSSAELELLRTFDARVGSERSDGKSVLAGVQLYTDD